MIGRDALSCMKPSVYLINTSRGAVIDQIVLTEMLRARRTARAALHVLEQEPPSPGDPILKLDNVIVLPHIGTATAEAKCTAIDRRDANANPRGVRSLLNPLPRHFDVFELGKATINRSPAAPQPKVYRSVQKSWECAFVAAGRNRM